MKSLISSMIIACSAAMLEVNFAIAEFTVLTEAIVQPKPQKGLMIVQNSEFPSEIDLTQEGTGTYSVNSRFRGRITDVSLRVSESGEAELIFQNSDQQLVRFRGEVIRRDPYGIKVDLTDSDVLDASGVADIQYSSDRSLIYSIFVAGTVDNQIFSISFNR
ncbi:MAG: hypothetical protein SWJ54_20980 [Cyanobacteriota bacterium]|nr:hypothetical protein [Cyanobacteriota bacterium]